MPSHSETRYLPYSPTEIFELVADVARYPEFLPWCKGARVYGRKPGLLMADLVIGFKMFSERFTSKVSLEKPGIIHVDYVKGPLKYLHNEWRFFEDARGTRVEFSVDFEFKNRLFERLVGGLFTEAVNRMVAAFEKRASDLYGEAGRAVPAES